MEVIQGCINFCRAPLHGSWCTAFLGARLRIAACLKSLSCAMLRGSMLMPVVSFGGLWVRLLNLPLEPFESQSGPHAAHGFLALPTSLAPRLRPPALLSGSIVFATAALHLRACRGLWRTLGRGFSAFGAMRRAHAALRGAAAPGPDVRVEPWQLQSSEPLAAVSVGLTHPADQAPSPARLASVNVPHRDLNFDVPATDGRYIEVVATGWPVWQGAQA